MNAPNFADFPQGMEFMKQFWQQGAAAPFAANATSAPSGGVSPAFAQAMGQYMLPTFDLTELDKRISDLQTVLQFMELNTNMLRQSLSALEVQRNTLATLQSMAQAAPPAASTASSDAKPAGAGFEAPWLAAWQSMMQSAVSAGAASQNGAAPASAYKPAKQAAAKKAVVKKPAKKTAKKS